MTDGKGGWRLPALKGTIWIVAMVLLPSVCGALSFSDVTVGSGLVYDQNTQSSPSFQAKKSGGAAPGDFDNDGWVDLYVTRIDKSNILYRNKGNGTFQDVTVAAFGVDHLKYFWLFSRICG